MSEAKPTWTIKIDPPDPLCDDAEERLMRQGFSYVILTFRDGEELGGWVKAEDARLAVAAPDLLAALKVFVERYTEMVNSGDCGFWDPEKDQEVVAARAAIARAEVGAA